MIICIIVLISLRWYINILSLGDNEATSLGVNARGIRLICIIASTILISSSVCISGTIGWFGLVIPHLSRLIVGENHLKMIPMSFIMGVCSEDLNNYRDTFERYYGNYRCTNIYIVINKTAS